MTTDEVKKYLWQAYALKDKLQREELKLKELRSTVEYRSPSFEGMGGSGSGDKMSRTIERIIERSERVNMLACEYAAKFEEIEQMIKTIGNDNLEWILEMRYLNCMKWDEIAARINYSERQVLRLHGIALKKISEFAKDVTQCH
ncbi:DUF1492 domain-containing protein [Ruminococcus albus]|uniref:DUF1492 domain-containing protein n=1 Tax=Ruminococcus albus TaxID=1264 RepID=UPI000490E1E4|nr:DUF1492 domain-containing protein [Ruminococcus albus]